MLLAPGTKVKILDKAFGIPASAIHIGSIGTIISGVHWNGDEGDIYEVELPDVPKHIFYGEEQISAEVSA